MDKHTHTHTQKNFIVVPPLFLSLFSYPADLLSLLCPCLFVFRCFRWVWLLLGAGKVSERVKIVTLGGPWEFPLLLRPRDGTPSRVWFVFRFDEEFLSPSAKFVLNCRLAEL